MICRTSWPGTKSKSSRRCPAICPRTPTGSAAKGVFEKSITALRRFNALGYGKPDCGLTLTLVYNPVGPSLPPSQTVLEDAYRRELSTRYGVGLHSAVHHHQHADQPLPRRSGPSGA